MSRIFWYNYYIEFYIQSNRETYMSGIKDNHEDIMEIDTRLTTHEAICAERWKTVFNQLEGIERRASDRFDGVDTQVNRIETILISAAATGILAGGGLLLSLLSMIP